MLFGAGRVVLAVVAVVTGSTVALALAVGGGAAEITLAAALAIGSGADATRPSVAPSGR